MGLMTRRTPSRSRRSARTSSTSCDVCRCPRKARVRNVTASYASAVLTVSMPADGGVSDPTRIRDASATAGQRAPVSCPARSDG